MISADGLVDITRRKLIEFLVVTEYDDGDIDRAEHGQFISFLEQSAFTLEKGAEEDPDISK